MNQPSSTKPLSPSLLWVLAVVFGLFAGVGVVQAAVSKVDTAASVEMTAERVIVSGIGVLFPIDPSPRCEVLNNFGGNSKTYGGGGHQGVDIGANEWQEVYAVEQGILYRQFTGGNSGLGWGLLSVSNTKYRYFHLADVADGLEVGDEVTKGQVIGYVGDTGNASPGGWHLHFEFRPGPDHDVVDPVPLLDIPRTCNVY